MSDVATSPIFGYRHVSDVPLCPCRDPGNYMMMEQVGADVLRFRLTCWCGSTCDGSFDTELERIEFVREQTWEADAHHNLAAKSRRLSGDA